VAGEGILHRQVVEPFVEPVGGDAPGDERTGREIGGHEGLPDPADDAALQHSAQALEHRVDRQLAQARDLREGILEKSGDAVFADGEDARVDRIGDFGDRDRHGGKIMDDGRRDDG
jgi:hypothetical protein